MSFKDIAQDVINQSIQSVIYIDNNITKPYDTQGATHQLCSDIYKSFDENNTTVMFYKFTDDSQWMIDKENLFDNRDLLLLDWRLATVQPSHKLTLPILNHAVETDNILGIVIFTNLPVRDHIDIKHNICSYFSERKILPNDILEQVEEKVEEFGNTVVFIKESIEDLQSLVFDPTNARVTLRNLRDKYKTILGTDFLEFEEFIKDKFNSVILIDVYSTLGFVFNHCLFPSKPIKKIKFEVYDEYLIINNTYIFIEQKVNTVNLYSNIKNAITKTSNNFIPIMSLEMRNTFNNGSTRINKKLSSIDDYVLMHHKDNVEPKEAFFDFLKEIWKDQAFHFLSTHNSLKTFKELDNYRSEQKIYKKDIKAKLKSGELDQDLSQLNCFYNILMTSNQDRYIGFGDIYKIRRSNKYILCVTAHCDCLYPEDNLNNNLYFVEGTQYDLNKGLIEGDSKFNSFIEDKQSEDILCIKWSKKPITVNIPLANNNINSEISFTLNTQDYKANYVATLKENYTQRMANRAFTFPLRVGIFFAKK